MKLGVVRRDSFETQLGSLQSDKNMMIAAATIKGHGFRARKTAPTMASLLQGTYIFGEGLEASDPRDYIFALLGMSNDAADLHIAPDYSKSKAQVYTEVAIAFIKQLGLKVLAWSNFGISPDKQCHLPSWVPDWSSPFLAPLGTLGRKTDFQFMASRNSAARFQFLDGSDEFPILCVSGVHVDTIRATGQRMTHSPVSDLTWLTNDQDPNYSLQLEWLSDIKHLSESCGNVYGSSQKTKDAIWRTPIADQEFTSEAKNLRASRTMQTGYRLYRTGFVRATISQRELQQRSNDFRLAAMYWRQMVTRSSGRKYFVTQHGFLALGPPNSSPGDVIAVILGLDTPFVLRYIGQSRYQIVGEAYVHGIMDGEVMKDPVIQDFCIC